TAPFINGPLGVGVHIETDALFQALNAGITRNDDFQTLIYGVFRPQVDGDHTFGIDWPDDRGSFWVDLDQDGRFEVEGNHGNEWMNEGSQAGYKTVSLKRGQVYNVAIAHYEGNGNSRVVSYLTAPGLVRQTLNPAGLEQRGMWGVRNPIDFNKVGVYTITYTARDAVGNEATATRTVIVEEPQDPPVLSLKGSNNLRHPVGEEFTDPGVEIADAEGVAIDGAEALVGGHMNPNAVGTYIITYDYMDAKGAAAITITRQVEVFDNKPPVITLTGEAEIEIFQGAEFVDPGFAATDNSGLEIDVVSTADIPRAGLQLHLDASHFAALLKEGDPIPVWADLSGFNRHASDTRGEPTFAPRAINGHPAVHFDAEDLMATPHHFGNRQYSLLTVSQFDGGTAGRLISSRDVNYILGYWQGREDIAHLEGWVNDQNAGPLISTDPHLYTATNTGTNRSQFYSDGVNLTENASPNGRIGKIQFGGYQAANELSSGYIAEVIIYDRVLTNSERLGVEAYLNGKYGLNGYAEVTKLNVSKLGTYTITYVAADASGNVATATRVVKVVPDPSVPVITLNGDTEFVHHAGADFIDPGAVAKDAEGNILDDTLVGVGNVNPTTLGLYTLDYDYSTEDGKAAPTVTRSIVVADTHGPVITLNGEEVVRIGVGESYTDAGAIANDLFSGERPVNVQSSNPALGYEPGLLAGGMAGNLNSTTPNNGSFGVDPLGPSYSESKSSPPWAGNWTIVYTGQIFDEDGKVSFTEHIDDKAWLKVNGQQLLNDDGWNRRTEKSVDFGEGGWFDFEFRMSNGGGGAGVAGAPGFGYDPDGGNNYSLPRNTDGQMDLFRVPGYDLSTLDTTEAGTFTFTYTSSDALGNSSTAIRTIIVTEDQGQPFLTLVGETEVIHEAGTAYTDAGAKAFNGDGSVASDNIAGEGEVDTQTPGSYSLAYNFEDADGKKAETLTRTVVVVDTTAPVISLGEFDGDTDFVRLFENQEYTDPGATAKDAVDGDVLVFSDLEEIPNALLSHAYTFGSNENQLDFSADTSLFNQTPNAIHLFRRELKFSTDGDFRSSNPGITRNDNFQNLWHGLFTAKRSGEFEFYTNRTDDRSTVWIDLDGDGLFERDGDGGDERITWQNGGFRFILEKGKYRVAIGHLEWGGGSSVEISLRTPENAGPFDLALINP
ncbi:MAG: immunoglobulin-like domain-containing protein, partial [Opitutae bacterium]